MKKSSGLTLVMEMVGVIGVERVRIFGHVCNRDPSKPLTLRTLDFILYVHRCKYIHACVSIHPRVHALTRKK